MQILERMNKETAREYALRTINHNIISLDLTPGSIVSENELGNAMGISRTPIREALIELNKLKLVEIYPQKGSVIALIDPDIVDETRYLRLILESSMVEMACDIANTEDVFNLKENLRLQEYYIAHGNLDKQFELDGNFHKMLFTICNKELTYSLLGGLMTHFDRVRSLSLNKIRSSKILEDHKTLIEAIESQDKELAKSTITDHLSRYIIDEKELMLKYPQYFKSSTK